MDEDEMLKETTKVDDVSMAKERGRCKHECSDDERTPRDPLNPSKHRPIGERERGEIAREHHRAKGRRESEGEGEMEDESERDQERRASPARERECDLPHDHQWPEELSRRG